MNKRDKQTEENRKILAAYKSLDGHDNLIVGRCAKKLMDKCQFYNLGEIGALEVLYKLGRYLNKGIT